MRFGRRLKERREDKGLTQQQLGKLINVSDATINRYERDLREPGIETIKLLSKVLDCTTDYLFGVSDQLKPGPPSKDEEEDELDFVIAAHNEGEYGQAPSPELKQLIKDIVKEELARVKKK
jgi:transcriptional regulator with XRE-family HTH domain